MLSCVATYNAGSRNLSFDLFWHICTYLDSKALFSRQQIYISARDEVILKEKLRQHIPFDHPLFMLLPTLHFAFVSLRVRRIFGPVFVFVRHSALPPSLAVAQSGECTNICKRGKIASALLHV